MRWFRVAYPSSEACDWMFRREMVAQDRVGRGLCRALVCPTRGGVCLWPGKREAPGADADVRGLWAAQLCGVGTCGICSLTSQELFKIAKKPDVEVLPSELS